ncbi:MAG: hypothetical protein V4615_14225 [Bacteroidota bacterium]
MFKLSTLCICAAKMILIPTALKLFVFYSDTNKDPFRAFGHLLTASQVL